MDPSSSSQSPAILHQPPATPKAEEEEDPITAVGGGQGKHRREGKRLGRQRLITYVRDILRHQRKPLHEIVLEHVLPFLPAAPLSRLRAVSTSWNARVSAPFFAHSQTLSHRSLSGLLLCDPNSEPSTIHIPFHPYSANAVPDPYFDFLLGDAHHAVASSNGLVCFSNNPCNGTRRYVLCNPATMESTPVPVRPFNSYAHDGVALVFQPSVLNFSCDYDLVCTYSVREERKGGQEGPGKVSRRFEVFSSRDGEWRLSPWEMKAEGYRGLLSPHGVNAGGRACWRTTTGEVLLYDPAADEAAVVDIPEDARSGFAVWQLGELGGTLGCVCCSAEDPGVIKVFVLREEDDGGWMKVREIEVVPGGIADLRPLMFEGGNGEVVVWVDGVVIGFRVATGERRLLCDTGGVVVAEIAEYLPYISSLAFVKSLAC